MSYDNNKREISLSLSGIGTNPDPVDRLGIYAQSLLGVYTHKEYECSVTIFEYDGKNIAFELFTMTKNAGKIAASTVRAPISGGVCYFSFEDSWRNTGNGVLQVLDNNNLSLNYYGVNDTGLWSVSIGSGEYYRYGDVPYDYEPMEF